MPLDYSGLNHEELAEAADPLNRIVNRDVPILGYEPTDEQVEEAKAELVALNVAARARNDWDPHHPGAMGPEGSRLPEDEVKLLIEHRLKLRADAEAEAEA